MYIGYNMLVGVTIVVTDLVHNRVTPVELSLLGELSRKLSSLLVGGVVFDAWEFLDRSVPALNGGELTHSLRVIDAVAYAAVEEGGTCVPRFLKWEGIFLEGVEVAEE